MAASAAPFPELIDEDYARALADVAGLTIPAACLEGVIANLRLLADHAARLAREGDLS